jgi:hypothetical protein
MVGNLFGYHTVKMKKERMLRMSVQFKFLINKQKNNNKQMKKLFFTTAALLVMSATNGARAQVTIGSNVTPQSYSILELESSGTRGLRLPQLTTIERNNLTPTLEGNSAAQGLQIFNTSTECVETWNGTKWIKQCGGEYVKMTVPTGCSTPPPPVRFAKYNLGADPTLDNPKKQIEYLANPSNTDLVRVLGDLYQWGRVADGHEKRDAVQYSTSGALSGNDLNTATGQVANDYGAAVYNKADTDKKYGHFIKSNGDWRTQKDDLWGNGEGLNGNPDNHGGIRKIEDNKYYQNTNWVIPGNNPCPDGFRVPTQDEWERICNYDCNPGSRNSSTNIATNTDLTWVTVAGGKKSDSWSDISIGGFAIYDAEEWKAATTNSGGYFYNVDWSSSTNMKRLYDDKAPEPLIFLPSAGIRVCNSGSLSEKGVGGYYWSSTVVDTKAYNMYFGIMLGTIAVNTTEYARANGMSVRCVEK